MRIVASIIVASMMGMAAWASDLPVETVGDLYTGQPAGFEVTGLAQGDKGVLKIIEDDGAVVLWRMSKGDAQGTAVAYALGRVF